jgi:hypothetical protein
LPVILDERGIGGLTPSVTAVTSPSERATGVLATLQTIVNVIDKQHAAFVILASTFFLFPISPINVALPTLTGEVFLTTFTIKSLAPKSRNSQEKMVIPLPPSLRGDVAAATGGSKSSNYAVNHHPMRIISLAFAVCNRGLQVIASFLLPPAAKAAFPPQRGRQALATLHNFSGIYRFSFPNFTG